MERRVDEYLQFLEFKDVYEKTIYEMQFLTESDIKKNNKVWQKVVDMSKKGLSEYKINPSFLSKHSNALKKEIESSYKRGIPAEKASKRLITNFLNDMKKKVAGMDLSQKIILTSDHLTNSF